MPVFRSNAAYQRRAGGLSDNQKQVVANSAYLDSQLSDPLITLIQNNQTDLEIGFGTGDYLISQAQTHQNSLQIGIDLYLLGIATTLQKAEQFKLNNVYILYQDAFDFLTTSKPEISFSNIRIYHPDPWPKKRHHKRRLLDCDSLRGAFDLLKPQGKIEILSDDPSYTEAIADLIESSFPSNQISIAYHVAAKTKYGDKAIAAGRSITQFMIHRC